MVSIIIVNYKVKNELFECLSSIEKINQGVKYEIIVVDNSEDNLIESELKNKFSKVKYINSEKNLGYGGGNNLGAKYSKGDYLLILNPDTKLISGKISNIVNFIKKNKKVGAVAPLLINQNSMPFELQGVKDLTPKRAIFSLSIVSRIFPRNKIYKEYYMLGWDKSKKQEVDVVPGTAFIIKKDIFEKIGGFDEKFFLFFEEFDLCRRLKGRGYKNYINPDLKIYHKWGASTAKNEFTKKYFLKSRFYYFKKNYGLIKALLVESFLRVNKEFVFLFGITILALVLRFYRLSEVMAFIGDTAWYFVSAKDMIISGQIPLVGITSSHTWLHQGAFWTYILAFLLPLFNFNPVSAAYFTAILDVFTLLIIYFFCKKYFDQKIALFTALFYATSPLIVLNAQIPYHTNPIPLLTILLIISVLKWLKGNIKYFPVSIFLLAVLYNFEISIIPLGLCVFLIFTYGFFKKREWARKILNAKIIIASLIALIIPMLPMLIYDLSHMGAQTVKVVVWSFYRLAVLFGYPSLHPDVPDETWTSFVSFTLGNLKAFYFMQNVSIAIILFFLALVYLIYKAKKYNFKKLELNILIIFILIPIAAFIGAKTNSGAYLPMLYPQLAIIIGYLFGNLNRKHLPIGIFIIILISLINIYSVIDYDRGAQTLDKRIDAVRQIIKQAENKSYNVVMEGENANFESTGAQYRYLLWRLGNEPSINNQKIKFFVTDASDTIKIEKRVYK